MYRRYLEYIYMYIYIYIYRIYIYIEREREKLYRRHTYDTVPCIAHVHAMHSAYRICQEHAYAMPKIKAGLVQRPVMEVMILRDGQVWTPRYRSAKREMPVDICFEHSRSTRHRQKRKLRHRMYMEIDVSGTLKTWVS